MTTDHDLDVRLQSARGVREQDLPALSASFLAYLHTSADSEPTVQLPASVLAARQLVADAHERRGLGVHIGRRRPSRRAVLRLGGALLAVAAVGITAVVVTSPGEKPPPTAAPSSPQGETTSPAGPVDPPGGLTLVASQMITFPYSLDPAPEGLVPALAKFGGIGPSGPEPLVWMATYQSARNAGFTIGIAAEDLRGRTSGPVMEDDDPADVRETGTVAVNGIPAEFTRGEYASPRCENGPSTPSQTHEPDQLCSSSFARLAWQRPDGQWAYVWSDSDTYSTVPALVSVAESVVDRPQPVRLQVGLSPEGWSVSGYETGGLTLISDADPSISNRIGISLQERWRGYDTASDVLRGMTEGNPVQRVTVKGKAAELVSVPDPFTGPGNPRRQEPRRKWYLAGELPDGVLFLFEAPDTLSREDVLAMAERVDYTP